MESKLSALDIRIADTDTIIAASAGIQIAFENEIACSLLIVFFSLYFLKTKREIELTSVKVTGVADRGDTSDDVVIVKRYISDQFVVLFSPE
jgi:hypothetical protein